MVRSAALMASIYLLGGCGAPPGCPVDVGQAKRTVEVRVQAAHVAPRDVKMRLRYREREAHDPGFIITAGNDACPHRTHRVDVPLKRDGDALWAKVATTRGGDNLDSVSLWAFEDGPVFTTTIARKGADRPARGTETVRRHAADFSPPVPRANWTRLVLEIDFRPWTQATAQSRWEASSRRLYWRAWHPKTGHQKVVRRCWAVTVNAEEWSDSAYIEPAAWARLVAGDRGGASVSADCKRLSVRSLPATRRIIVGGQVKGDEHIRPLVLSPP